MPRLKQRSTVSSVNVEPSTIVAQQQPQQQQQQQQQNAKSKRGAKGRATAAASWVHRFIEYRMVFVSY
jgi:flagellar hook-length control protein FliK